MRSPSPLSPSRSASKGARRMRLAEEGLAELAGTVDTVIAIPNDRLLTLAPQGHQLLRRFKMSDDLLRQAVQGISDIIVTPGLINRDFSDIKATMIGHGLRHDGHGHGAGRKCRGRSGAAGHQLPAAGRHAIAGSRGILINITGSSQPGPA